MYFSFICSIGNSREKWILLTFVQLNISYTNNLKHFACIWLCIAYMNFLSFLFIFCNHFSAGLSSSLNVLEKKFMCLI